jgi:hypothetical protein
MTISAEDSQLTLTERSEVETPLLRAYHNSLEEQHRTSAWKAYVRFLLGESQQKALTVTYHTRQGSRLYATLPAAQLLSSSHRLFLFGRNHVEVDLVAAALQIYIFATCGELQFQGSTAAEWRHRIQADLAAVTNSFTTDKIKQLINIFLNTSADKVISLIRQETMFPPQSVLTFFRQLEVRRPGLVHTARCLGFEPRGASDTNICYFAMEYLEQRYIRHFLSGLSRTKELHSVVLVHDGLYLSPSLSLEEVARASETAAAAAGLPVLQLNFKDLSPIWQRQFGHLERQAVTQQAQAKRRRLATEDGVGADNGLPTHVRTGYVLHFVPQTRKLVRKRAHLQVEPPTSNMLTPPKARKLTFTSRTNRQQNVTELDVVSASSTLHAYFSKKRLFGE